MEKSYRVEKYIQGKGWLGYGSLPEADVKEVIKGYKKNAKLTMTFYKNADPVEGVYTRKGTTNMFQVTAW